MSITSEQELKGMRRAGRVVALALRAMRDAVEPGVTTAELDRICARVLAEHGARSAPQVMYGAPCSAFVSVNDQAVHGLPGPRTLRAGDMVKLDVTAELGGFVADAAITVVVPPASELALRLVACAEAALQAALTAARAGVRVNELGAAMEREVRRHGFRVLKELTSHGVGRAIHEEPTIPNFYHPRFRRRVPANQVITLEPIIAVDTERVVELPDGWTIASETGALTAHVEHTLMVRRGQPLLLTVA
ncbi:methionyl aminopeptidase [Deinobacterium chartae]|uniref:Methionine aminopeptidase n=1 Tax=Deinobacterium chartae TaxID=521158 RepID=A0A841HZU9_9DEIO|nr:type I methionyl aminopeptidase [Deinobacterium chartae]MBB6098214.1 methionyl aminopeptidase [Deinobacterium chartae]